MSFNLSCHEEADSQLFYSKAWKICDGKDDFVDFLQDHGFEEQRILFLDSITEHEEIGDVLWRDGDYLAAISRFKRSTTASSKRKSVECLLDGLRSNVTFGSQYDKPTPLVSRLLNLGQELCRDGEGRVEVSSYFLNLSGAFAEISAAIFFPGGCQSPCRRAALARSPLLRQKGLAWRYPWV